MNITILAQILSVIAMAFAVLSMQCRRNRNFFICQGISGTLFTVSFILFGAWSGALMNIFSAVRTILLNNKKIATSKWTLFALTCFLLACSLTTFLYFKDKWYLVLILTIAQFMGTYSMWTQKGSIIRYIQLSVISPLWLTYNFLLPIPSIGGILTETLNITSVVIALIRYRKIGFSE